MPGPLTVAAAQPAVLLGDLAHTARSHAAAVRAARARLVVLPELSLTGYVLDAPAVAPDDPALAPLAAACAQTGTVALAGAPVPAPGGGRSIGVLRVDGTGAQVVYRKRHLGGDEPRSFVAGDEEAVLELDGWRIGLGVCRDTGVDAHVEAMAALDLDLYAAGVVHHAHELAEQDRRGRRLAAACGAPVVLASAAGRAGGEYDAAAGTSTIFAATGEVLARADSAPGSFARITLASG
jgi:predicted amidohydrolase